MGNIDVLRFVFDNGYPTNPDLVTAISKAIASGGPGAQACAVFMVSRGDEILDADTRARAVARWGEGWEQDAASSGP